MIVIIKVAVVPIKLQNERLPGKNLKPFFDGKPLISFVLDSLTKLSELDKIYVYCSDPSIKKYLPEKVEYLKRPQYLDAPSATPQDIIDEFMHHIYADVYMVSHVTAPFVSISHLHECLQAVIQYNYDSAFTACRLQQLMWDKELKPVNFCASNIPRTNDLPTLFAEVSAAYVFTREIYLKTRSRIGGDVYIVDLSKIESIDIDDSEDFEIADALYKYILKKNQ